MVQQVRLKDNRNIQIHENENTTQILWDSAKTVLREKFTVLKCYYILGKKISN